MSTLEGAFCSKGVGLLRFSSRAARQFHGRTKARQELPPLFRQRESPPRELRPDNLNNNRLRTSQLQNKTALKETTYIVAKS